MTNKSLLQKTFTMKTISRNKILLNAYSPNDLTVANGRLVIASTPISLLWKKLFGYKVESYAAGSYSTLSIDFSGITAVSNGPHRLMLKNSNSSAIQRTLEMVVYGDATATATEIATLFSQQVQNQSGPNSVFEWVSFSANVLTLQLKDTTYPIISYTSDIVGLTSVVTSATLPVGDSDAASVSGYVPGTQYDKYTFQEEGTVDQDGVAVNVLFEDVVYVDDTIAAFGTDHAASVSALTDITDATVRPYEAASAL